MEKFPFIGVKLNMEKIPCIVLVYYNVKIIKESLDFLLKSSDELEFIVIENKSINSEEKIKPYLMELLHTNKISMYVEFMDNISNNALEEFFQMNIIDLNNYKNIVITDGDIKGNSQAWLEEEKSILNRHSEILVCGVDFTTDNLPLRQFEDAVNWIAKPRNIYHDYIECATGAHLLLMRTKDLIKFLKYMKNKNLKFKDSVILDYCYKVLGKKWAKTKVNKSIHLTWSIYSDLNNPYTKYKLSKSHDEFWYHNKYCDFAVHTLSANKLYKYKVIKDE